MVAHATAMQRDREAKETVACAGGYPSLLGASSHHHTAAHAARATAASKQPAHMMGSRRKSSFNRAAVAQPGTVTAIALFRDDVAATGDSYGTIRVWSCTRTAAHHQPSAGDDPDPGLHGTGMPGGGISTTEAAEDVEVLSMGLELQRQPLIRRGRRRPRTLLGHTKAVSSLAFRPSDGAFLVSCGRDSTLRLWHVRHRRHHQTYQVWAVRHVGGLGDPLAMAWSPDGNTIAIGGVHKLIVFWDVTPSDPDDTESPPRVVRLADADCLTHAAEGVAAEHTVALLPEHPEYGPERLVSIEMSQMSGTVNGLSFSPDSLQLIVATASVNLQLWLPHSPDTFRNGLSANRAHNRVWRQHHNPWGAGVDTNASATASREEVNQSDTVGPWRSKDVVLSPDGAVLVREQGPNIMFGSEKRDAPDETPRKHDASIRACAWSPTAAKYVATVSDDKSAIIWNTETLAAKSRFFHDSPLRDCAFSADGTLLLTAGREMTVWNVAAEARVRTLRGEGISTVKMPSVGIYGTPPGCAFGMHTMLTVARGCRHARLWSDVSPADPLVVHVTAAANRRERARLLKEQADEMGGGSASAAHAALVGHDLFSPSSEADKAARVPAAPLWCVAASPNAEFVATGGEGGVGRTAHINLWCAKTGQRRAHSDAAHRNWIWDLAWTPDSDYVVSAGADGTAAVWKVVENDAEDTADGGAGRNSGGRGRSTGSRVARSPVGLFDGGRHSPPPAGVRAPTQPGSPRGRTSPAFAARQGSAAGHWYRHSLVRVATFHCGTSIALEGSRDAVHTIDITVVHSVAVSCVGGFCATASDDGVIRVWDLPAAVAKGEAAVRDCVQKRDAGRDAQASQHETAAGDVVTPAPGGTHAVLVDNDLDGRDDALDVVIALFTLAPRLGAARCVAFHPQVEDYIAAAVDYPAVVVWDLNKPNAADADMPGPAAPPSLVFGDQPTSLAPVRPGQRRRRASVARRGGKTPGSGAGANDARELVCRIAFFTEHTHAVQSIVFVSGVGDTCQLISAAGNGDTLLWSVNSSGGGTTVIHRLPLVGDGESLSENRSVAIREDGKIFATVCSSTDEGDSIILWDTVTGKMLLLLSGHTAAPYGATFFGERSGIASVDMSGVLLIHRADVDNFVHNAPSASNSMLLLLTGPPLQARLLLDRQSDVMLDTAISPYRFERAMEATMGDCDDPTVDEALEFRRALLSDGVLGHEVRAPCQWLGCILPDVLRRVVCCCFRSRSAEERRPNGAGSARSQYQPIGAGGNALGGGGQLVSPTSRVAQALSGHISGHQNEGKTLGQLIRAAAQNNEKTAGFRGLSAISNDALLDWRLKFKALHRGVCLDESTMITHYPFAWASPLHVLADATLNNVDDAGAMQRKLRQEDLVEEWKELSMAKYAPVVNSAGQTPFEVGVRTGNTLFVQVRARGKEGRRGRGGGGAAAGAGPCTARAAPCLTPSHSHSLLLALALVLSGARALSRALAPHSSSPAARRRCSGRRASLTTPLTLGKRRRACQ